MKAKQKISRLKGTLLSIVLVASASFANLTLMSNTTFAACNADDVSGCGPSECPTFGGTYGADGCKKSGSDGSGNLDCSVLPDALCKSGNGNTNEGGAIMELLKWVLRIMTAGVGVVAVAALVYAGILYSSASDKQDQMKKSKDMIMNTIIGLVLYALMFIILNYLIPGGVFGS